MGKPNTIHTYIKSFNQWQTPGFLEAPATRLLSCPDFMQLSPTDRRNMLVALGGCLCCTAFSHHQEFCTLYRPLLCRKKGSDGTVCDALHPTALHGGDRDATPPLAVSVDYPRTTDDATPAAGSTVVVGQDQETEALRRLMRIRALRKQVKEEALPLPDVLVAPPSIRAAPPREIEELRTVCGESAAGS